ncbi:hypothetical protein [Sphingomonas bacterium]|uniref:hypothetical protein n=1 Tax=Sphingomonas bacterium TaxID=1895847 RepID=UPI0026101F9E|nr:hypothetical protein [Sphingomonas bacterium]MDB5678389.1 hypothetical protein [Sphingomonas bacterium]
MTEPDEDVVPEGLADLPLEVRRAREIDAQRELNDGLTRRHLGNAAFAQAYDAVQFDRILRMGKREG